MRFSKLGMSLRAIACVFAVTSMLVGCGSDTTAPTAAAASSGSSSGSGSGSGSGGGSSSGSGASTIQGVTTPSSVSVVTAN